MYHIFCRWWPLYWLGICFCLCKPKKTLNKTNGMLRHTLGGAVILFSLQQFIAPALDYQWIQSDLSQTYFLLLFSWTYSVLQVKTLFQKLWPLMYKRAEWDLRSKKLVYPFRLLYDKGEEGFSHACTILFLLLWKASNFGIQLITN